MAHRIVENEIPSQNVKAGPIAVLRAKARPPVVAGRVRAARNEVRAPGGVATAAPMRSAVILLVVVTGARTRPVAILPAVVTEALRPDAARPLVAITAMPMRSAVILLVVVTGVPTRRVASPPAGPAMVARLATTPHDAEPISAELHRARTILVAQPATVGRSGDPRVPERESRPARRTSRSVSHRSRRS
ncbi:hypothetical protein GCM10023318_41010 [Nocardia callitridis]|uniref:Uncharacterized protein n=1 Tax=Nocardia callitridis TaxID=648753 RepID=A0ABP9KJ70_9NOCA